MKQSGKKDSELLENEGCCHHVRHEQVQTFRGAHFLTANILHLVKFKLQHDRLLDSDNPQPTKL